MLDHLIDPDIPTKRQELEQVITQIKDEISALENQFEGLKNNLICLKSELSDRVVELHALEPDPDYLRD